MSDTPIPPNDDVIDFLGTAESPAPKAWQPPVLSPAAVPVDPEAAGNSEVPVKLDLTASDVPSLASTPEDERREERRTTDPDHVFDPSIKLPPSPLQVQRDLDEQKAAVMAKITWTDKQLYWKSIMFDEPVEFPISFTGAGDKKVTLYIQSRTMREEEIAYATARIPLAQGGPNPDNQVAGYTRVVQGLASIQCLRMEVDGSTRSFEVFKESKSETIEQNAQRLHDHLRKHIFALPGALWGMVFHAIQIFELKSVVCYEQLDNEDFWKPADTDS